jgi:hypothetical protein
MGQYFAAVNTDKKEFVCPWCIGGVAKLWEWAANSPGAIFTLLLRKSDEGGGGDFYGYHRGCGEGGPITCPLNAIAGRWAGDHVALVGDYDSSQLWSELYEHKSYRNISKSLVATWNEFIQLDDRKLTFRPCDSCTPE